MRATSPTPRRDDLIFDVGMHRGEDTDYYLRKGFRVVGFEADPRLAEECRTRFADAVAEGTLVIVEGAIVDPDSPDANRSTTTFYRNLDRSAWGTTRLDWAARNERLGTRNEAVEVNVVAFPQWLEQCGIPHYLKIDIEGTDLACLKALLNFDSKPVYLSLESEKVSFVRLEEQLDLLERLGFREFKAVQQGLQHGASGPFGNDLPGRWKPRNEILAEYRSIFMLYRTLGVESPLRRTRTGTRIAGWLGRLLGKPWLPGWHDIHARHSQPR